MQLLPVQSLSLSLSLSLSPSLSFPAAILCAAAPEIAPFMADESVLSVPGLGKLDYTQKHYMTYAAKVQEKAKELSQIGNREISIHYNACL